MVELQQPRPIIPRVDGQNLHILVDHPYVYLRRDDVEALAGIPPWGTGEKLLLDDDQVVDINGAEYYPLETALHRARYESLTPSKADAFLQWVEAELPQYLTPEVLEAAHRVPAFSEAYTVAGAARLLDQDPEISTGRDRLFDHMAELGWIERNTEGVDAWIPTSTATSRDWLTLRTVYVGPRRNARPYLQIHITNAGLTELRRTLAGTARSTTRPAHPTLFD
ncbi:phage antirepressor KilAC domain-containing protein [Microbacterium sp. LjRoot45]|uniref:phage antirepressor KilAC domain-containing protein n=1 Tax=Microbacterium sp. LjRoot45 TaxID=3342329 RepID=UPI003ECE16EA